MVLFSVNLADMVPRSVVVLYPILLLLLMMRDCRFDHRPHGRLVAHVRLDGQGRAARSLDEPDGLLRALEVDVGDGHGRSGAGEALRVFTPDARARPRHDREPCRRSPDRIPLLLRFPEAAGRRRLHLS